MGAVMRIPVRISARLEDDILLFLVAGPAPACGVHESEQNVSANLEDHRSSATRVTEVKQVTEPRSVRTGA